jgi:hypothetical protein|tara:strand:- start:563 stop:1042 length:480 start_codon:yes stop_codon:yes gene_type:complete
MGLFNRKKPVVAVKSVSEQVDDLVQQIHALLETDKEVSAIVLTKQGSRGTHLVQGNGGDIRKMLESIANEHSDLDDILKDIASRHDAKERKESLDSMPSGLKDLIDKMGSDRSAKVTLPDGTKALAIKADDIDNITDEEVNRILDEMINGANEEDSSED